MSRFYRRHLPHGAPDDSLLFVTWNLKGSLPESAVGRIKKIREQFGGSPGDNGLKAEIAKQIFRITESYLDRAQSGPLYLKDPQAAGMITSAILGGAGKWYALYAFVVMANHVHVLLEPFVDLNRITGGIKQKTARKINALINRTGEPFWQDESFDHRPRGREMIAKTIRYIENNPVKAGLCAMPEAWPWSSASMRSGWPIGSAYIS